MLPAVCSTFDNLLTTPLVSHTCPTMLLAVVPNDTNDAFTSTVNGTVIVRSSL